MTLALAALGVFARTLARPCRASPCRRRARRACTSAARPTPHVFLHLAIELQPQGRPRRPGRCDERPGQSGAPAALSLQEFFDRFGRGWPKRACSTNCCKQHGGQRRRQSPATGWSSGGLMRISAGREAVRCPLGDVDRRHAHGARADRAAHRAGRQRARRAAGPSSRRPRGWPTRVRRSPTFAATGTSRRGSAR